MTKDASPAAAPFFLGVECGGTRTAALLVDAAPQVVREIHAGPANLRLLSDAQLVRHFRGLGLGRFSPASLAIGMAGARTEADRERIRRAAARVWPGVPCLATNDLETALLAAEIPASSGRRPAAVVRVLVLSGTGSCCFGRAHDGRTAKLGGWGHILGDKGSGYEIGLRAQARPAERARGVRSVRERAPQTAALREERRRRTAPALPPRCRHPIAA